MYKIKCAIKDCLNKIDDNYGYCLPEIDKVGKVLCFRLKKVVKTN
jgi:hypothetical protein